MADAGNGHVDGADEVALGIAARHALHDEELIAAFAAGGLDDGPETDRARSLIDRCSACRDLHRDLAAIGAAIRFDASFTATAPRDFRLTAADAERLGAPISARGALGGFRRLVQGFGRPIGASLATLGVVGLLVGSMSLTSFSASAPSAMDAAASSGAGSEVQAGSAGLPEQPKASERTTAFGPNASPAPTRPDSGVPTERDVTASGASGLALLFGGSVLLLFFGLGLLMVTARSGPRERS